MSQLSIQLFTVRRWMKKPRNIRQTLERLQHLGVVNLEAARLKFTLEEAKLIKTTCGELNMKVVCSQIKYDTIMTKFETLIEIHQLWGCHTMAVSVLPTQYILQGEAGIRKFSVLLNELGKRLNERGLNLLYHHHHMEFARYGNKTGLDLLLELTDPNYVNLMMDVYWTQRGGKNPVTLMKQYADRVKVVHLRDYKVSLNKLRADYTVSDCALGDGNLDIEMIVETAKDSGVSYLAIEQDTKEPFKEIERSLSYLKTLNIYQSITRKVGEATI